MLTTLKKKLAQKKWLKLASLLLAFAGLFYANSALADSSTTPAILEHNFNIIAKILQTVSILFGLAIALGGMFHLKRYGEMRTFMSHQMTLAKPFMAIMGGVALLILPTFIPTLMLTFWSSSSPLTYNAGPSGYEQYIPPILMYVRLIGVGAVIRGLVLVSRSGGQGGQPGMLGKAIIYLFGGILAIHILGTVQLLSDLMGVSVTF